MAAKVVNALKSKKKKRKILEREVIISFAKLHIFSQEDTGYKVENIAKLYHAINMI